MESMLETLLLDMKELQKYLYCHDLQRLGSLSHKWSKRINQEFWVYHLKTLLGTQTVPKIEFRLKGYHIEYFYIGLLNRLKETTRKSLCYRFFLGELPFQNRIHLSLPLWKILCASRSAIPRGFLFMNTRGHIDLIENLFYFEVKIEKLPVYSQDETIPCMSIGLCTQRDAEYIRDAGFMTGWTERSIGFHTDDGKVFYDSSSVMATDDPVREGDVIGCGIDLDCETIFFTKNSYLVYEEQFLFVVKNQMYPVIACDHDDFVFHTNFGAKPFLYMPLPMFEH